MLQLIYSQGFSPAKCLCDRNRVAYQTPYSPVLASMAARGAVGITAVRIAIQLMVDSLNVGGVVRVGSMMGGKWGMCILSCNSNGLTLSEGHVAVSNHDANGESQSANIYLLNM